jgi:hypothetical protein
MSKTNIAFWQAKAEEGSNAGLIHMGDRYLNGGGVE